jgi:hypothetical protein
MNELILSNNSQVVTMSSREIARLVESNHAEVKRSVDRLAARRVIAIPPMAEYLDALGRGGQFEYWLDKRSSYIVVAQLSPEFTARLVDRWQELEAKQAAPAALSVMDILHIAMESEKGRLLAIEQRDQAIATKAQIGSKREATAMATASAAKKESAKLKDQLGFSARHATIMQVEAALGGDFNFLPLRKWCNSMEVTPETVPDKRYPKGVKAWPAGAWANCYGVDLMDLFGEVAA